MKKYTRLLSAFLMLLLVLALGFSVVALAYDGGDTPIIEWPFDDEAEPTPPVVAPDTDGTLSPGVIVLIIVGSILLVAVIGFFVNWFFVLGRSAADLKGLFSKKPTNKRK
jgi:energy-coupling factor transporter transmembrane protein EcfT